MLEFSKEEKKLKLLSHSKKVLKSLNEKREGDSLVSYYMQQSIQDFFCLHYIE